MLEQHTYVFPRGEKLLEPHFSFLTSPPLNILHQFLLYQRVTNWNIGARSEPLLGLRNEEMNCSKILFLWGFLICAPHSNARWTNHPRRADCKKSGRMTRKWEGLHRDLAETRSWSSWCKAGGKVRGYAWARGWWRLLGRGRPEICDFLQQQKHSFSALRSEFMELIKCPNNQWGRTSSIKEGFEINWAWRVLAESKRKWWVTVVRDSLLWRWRHTTAKSSCYHNTFLFFCFSEAPIHYIAERLPMIFHSLDHYPLLHIYMDTQDIA